MDNIHATESATDVNALAGSCVLDNVVHTSSHPKEMLQTGLPPTPPFTAATQPSVGLPAATAKPSVVFPPALQATPTTPPSRAPQETSPPQATAPQHMTTPPQPSSLPHQPTVTLPPSDKTNHQSAFFSQPTSTTPGRRASLTLNTIDGGTTVATVSQVEQQPLAKPVLQQGKVISLGKSFNVHLFAL